jgi:hypothetical protein
MSVLTEIVEGWSDGLPFTLKADAVAVDLTGLTVTGIVKDRRGTTVSTTGKVSVTGTTSGIVTYTPATSDLTAAGQPYTVRFKVVDGTSAVCFFANGEPDLLVVYEA